MAKNKEVVKSRSWGSLFIPAGFLIGFGLGYLFNNLVSGIFIGIGVGFLAWIIYEIIRNRF